MLNPPQAAAPFVQIHQPSDVYSYELKPNGRGVGLLGEQISINSQGARDREYDPNKSGPRIVVLGDSFTFGMGVEVEESFVEQTEALISRERNEVQVINLGVIAYSFWQYLELLERRVPEYSPDLVIVAFFMDDLAGAKRPEVVVPRQFFEPDQDDWGSGIRVLNLVRNFLAVAETKSRTRRGADYLASIEKRKHHLQLENPKHLYAKIQQGALESSILEEFSSAVDFLAAWSVRTNVPILVVFIPDASQIHEADRQVVNDIAASEFKRAAIPFLDTTPHFEAIEDTGSLFLFPLDAHTSAKGHAVIANAIVEHPLIMRLK
jgi:lysophospholipase L1-like esterase